MLTFNMYAIKHVPTGFYLPSVNKDKVAERYASQQDPQPAEIRVPRLFLTKRAARNALVQWLRGAHHVKYETSGHGFEEETEQYMEVELIPSRLKEEMEVVVIRCMDTGFAT